MNKNKLNKVFLSVILLFIYTTVVFASQTKTSMNYDFIVNDAELDSLSLEIMDKILNKVDSINLTNDEKLVLEELRNESITYIPLNHNGSRQKKHLEEQFNIDVINKVFGLQIVFDNAFYTEEQLKEKLKSEEIYITSEYLFSNANLFKNGEEKFIRTAPYNANNVFVVHKEDYNFEKTNNKKIGITDRLSKYEYNDVDLLKGDVEVYSNTDARMALLNDKIDYYICEEDDLKETVYNSDLVYNKFDGDITNCQITLMTGMSTEKEALLSIINKMYTNQDLIEEYLLFFGFESANSMNEVFQRHLTQSEREYINNTTEIDVGLISTLILFEDNIGTFSGLVVDHLEILSKATGLGISYNSYDGISYKDILARMNKGEVDLLPLVLNKEESKNYFEENFKYLKFSITDSFIAEDIEIIKILDTKQLASYSQLNFSKIGILSKDTIIMYPFFESINFVNYDKLKIYSNSIQLSKAIENGEIDYGLALPGFIQYMNVYQNDRLMRADNFINKDKTSEWSFLVNLNNNNKDNEQLAKIINKALPIKKSLYLEQYFFDSSKVYNDKLQDTVENNNILSNFLFFTLVIVAGLLILLKNANRAATKLDYDISYDSVTNLKNYQSFVNLDMSKNDMFFLILVELINLEKIIEFYGINIGNDIVEEVANRIRKLDMEYEHTAFRAKSNKFIIVINYDKNNKMKEEWLKEELLEILTSEYIVNNINIKINFKIVSLDSAMYTDTLKNNFVSLENAANEMQSIEETEYRLLSNKDIFKKNMEKQIEKSLMEFEGDKIIPFFQPLISSETGKIVGCEVLARMQNKGEILLAGQFIPLAKKRGLLGRIDKLLFEKAIVFRNELLENNIIDEHFYFSINASVQMLREFDVVYLKKVKDKYNLKNFDFLQIELLEEFMESEFMEASVRAMKDNNLKTAVDDFSAGHSSLNRINSKYFDVVKIDRGVMPVDFKREHKLILKFIIDLLKGMGYKIISEGVETKEHVEFLKKMEVDVFQGYYYSKPLPQGSFIEYIKEKS